jgi:hypothetical protein
MKKKQKEEVITFPPPTLSDWRKLYALADRVKALAPWEWMDESHMFGVRDPDTEELGFVSVMGRLGEHFAIALYLGSEGLEGFQVMESGSLEDNPMMLMDVPQLQLSFADREEIDKSDREVMQKLNLKYRGAKSWPQFRSFCMGFLPWYLTGEEARFLAHALEQLLEMAPRLKTDPDFVFPEKELALSAGDDDEDDSLGEYLVREADKLENGSLQWRESMQTIPLPVPDDFHVTISPDDMDTAFALPLSQMTREIAFVPLPTPVGESGQRPYLPRGLFIVDAPSCFILALEMVPPLPNANAAWEKVPQMVLTHLAKSQARPGHIKVADELLYELLAPLCDQMRIKLSLHDELPAADAALESMFSMMGGRF